MSDLERELARLPEASRIERLKQVRTPDDGALAEAIADLRSRRPGASQQAALRRAEDVLHLAAQIEELPALSSEAAKIKQIKASPLYRDDLSQQSNWLAKALERLKSIKFDLNRPTKATGPSVGIFGAWFTYIMWVVLALAGITLVVFAFRHINWRTQLRRKSKAVLEEDEPERTIDEWLAQADALERDGKYRLAVRCLYLACLLKFDEARIARFDRGQTNWEHLTRIQASPTLPTALDFRPPTQAFDRIWYGNQVAGTDDVGSFRSWYQEVTARVAEKAAA